jgi:hypothetical protein
MNSAAPTMVPRRHIWRWVMLGVGLCLAPLVVLALVAASYVTLDRDAAVLRQQVMAATDANWSTKVQLTIGGATLGAVRSCLWLVHGKEVEDARLALAAVRHASVGVYERRAGASGWSRERIFAETDSAMAKRGWTRLVGVRDQQDTVLVYVPETMDSDETLDVCVAVVNTKELVVVSTSVDGPKLVELAASHLPDEVKGRLRLAKLRF